MEKYEKLVNKSLELKFAGDREVGVLGDFGLYGFRYWGLGLRFANSWYSVSTCSLGFWVCGLRFRVGGISR
jgi:hypothetical protein